jgi:dienelactone hydrolase
MTMRNAMFCAGILVLIGGCAETTDDAANLGLGANALPTAGAGAGPGASGPATAGGPGSASNAGPSSGAAGMTMTASAGSSAAGAGGNRAAGSGAAAGAGGDPTSGPMNAGTGGADPMPGPGGFPRGDEMNVARMGPYAFEKYTEGLENPTYASSVMYYPKDAKPPFAAAVFSPGFTATKENYEMFLGPLLASHGIAILLTTPTTTGDFPTQRAADLEAAVEQIKKENERAGGPLQGKLATDRVCVTGHSMGGGGTLFAASELGAQIRCAVPLQPWQPGQSFSKIVAPTMFIAAQSDTVAGVAQNASLFYDSIPDTVPKYYVEFTGASHFLTTNDLGTAYDEQSKYMVAFYKVYLEDDMRYLDVLNAPMDPALSQYKKSK